MPKQAAGGNGGKIVGISAAALIAAAAGAYFLYGKDAPKRRKAAKSWMLKAKAEVLEKMENMSDLDKNGYYELIDAAVAKYTDIKDVNTADIASLGKELKGYWSGIKQQFAPKKKTAKKTVKKVTKKAAKKTASKK